MKETEEFSAISCSSPEKWFFECPLLQYRGGSPFLYHMKTFHSVFGFSLILILGKPGWKKLKRFRRYLAPVQRNDFLNVHSYNIGGFRFYTIWKLFVPFLDFHWSWYYTSPDERNWRVFGDILLQSGEMIFWMSILTI